MAGLGREWYIQDGGYPETDTRQFVGSLSRHKMVIYIGYLRMTTYWVI